MLSIFTGSTLGSTEYIAEQVESLLKDCGVTTFLSHQPTLADLQNCTNLLVITATYGAGEVPESLNALFEELQGAEINLNFVNFAVIGVGSSDYDTFCSAAEQIEELLTQKGANKFYETLKIDVLGEADPEDLALDYAKNLITML